ncbi:MULTISPECIES: hypothetical protein [unclassified Methylobacterium]|uniref:hypothetical protein n=1 Tax=unclassified Methylobacterium TaxID=2615210 RepID=UPI001353A82C|nr:hypothetical protein [Methylobacterium sp. 2A]MWV22477.1 hypothetical protein [Methylobacterium sp. 2A]
MDDTETLDAPETRERLSPEARELRRHWLVTIGSTRWGPSWQTPMAEALSKASGREVPRPRVNQWAKGVKPLPAWATLALSKVAGELAAWAKEEAEKAGRYERQILDELGSTPLG